MGKRINIGIYIGPEDSDIAAWFNLLQENHMSRSKWVRGLFSAYSMQQPLDIGTIDPSLPLVKEITANQQLFFKNEPITPSKKASNFRYGWQVRGPNREFIKGSVINVSISKDEVLPIVNEVWGNGHQLATFVKSMIRQNLNYATEMIPPKLQNLQKIYAAFLVSQVHTKVDKSVQPCSSYTEESMQQTEVTQAQEQIKLPPSQSISDCQETFIQKEPSNLTSAAYKPIQKKQSQLPQCAAESHQYEASKAQLPKATPLPLDDFKETRHETHKPFKNPLLDRI